MESQWVRDVKAFAPNAVPVLPYVYGTIFLVILFVSIGLYKFAPPSDGIEVTDEKTGEKTKSKFAGWALFVLVVILVPIILGTLFYKLHFMIKNPTVVSTSMGTRMISDSIMGR